MCLYGILVGILYVHTEESLMVKTKKLIMLNHI